MRTSIDFDDRLFRKMKSAAALRGLSLRVFITRAVRHELESQQFSPGGRRAGLPFVPSARPGSLALDADRIAEILNGEDIHVSSGH